MMIASAIRGLAAAGSSPLIAAAFFEKTIQIWDAKSLKLINEFPTIYRTGAGNLVLTPDGNIVVTGRSTTSGKVVAYETSTGNTLWERRFVYPSVMRIDPSGETVSLTTNERSVIRLDVRSGSDVEVVWRARRRIVGPNGDVLSASSKAGAPHVLLSKGRKFEIRRIGFALLDATFSPDSICLGEASSLLRAGGEVIGPVRCFSLTDGALQWQFKPVEGHVLQLHYSSKLDAFYGNYYNFNSRTAPRRLLKFDRTSGTIEGVCEFQSWEDVFLPATDQILTSAGEIRDLSTGMVAGKLAFPTKEYDPDN